MAKITELPPQTTPELNPDTPDTPETTDSGQIESLEPAETFLGRPRADGAPPGSLKGVTVGAPDPDLTTAYGLVTQLAPLILAHQGDGTMSAVMLRGPADPPQKVRVGDYTLEAAFVSPRRIAGEPPPQGNRTAAAAIFIAAGPDEYFAAGSGLTVSFSPNTPGPPLAGLAL